MPLLHDSWVGGEYHLSEAAQQVHALGKRQGTKPKDFGFESLFFPVMRNAHRGHSNNYTAALRLRPEGSLFIGMGLYTDLRSR
jgi:hypothetical protein